MCKKTFMKKSSQKMYVPNNIDYIKIQVPEKQRELDKNNFMVRDLNTQQTKKQGYIGMANTYSIIVYNK